MEGIHPFLLHSLSQACFCVVDRSLVEFISIDLSSPIPISPQMDRYPRLRDEVEGLLMGFLREQEQKCKEHIQLMIEVELSYMNTNHPDFIGYQKLVTNCLSVAVASVVKCYSVTQ